MFSLSFSESISHLSLISIYAIYAPPPPIFSKEFEGANWEHDFGKEAEDGQLWQDDWDDDDTNDDFTMQLRQQIESTAAATATATAATTTR